MVTNGDLWGSNTRLRALTCSSSRTSYLRPALFERGLKFLERSLKQRGSEILVL